MRLQPSSSLLDLVDRRWVPHILVLLHASGGTVRFNQALTRIQGISDRMLTTRLRELVDVGLVRRKVEARDVVKVHYSLTERGDRVASALAQLVAAGAEVVAAPSCRHCGSITVSGRCINCGAEAVAS